MITGSFAVTIFSTLLALPIAIGSAIFVVEIAPGFGRRVFQPLIELLTGIPSVVYGLIGLGVIVATTRDVAGMFGYGITGYGIFSGSIVLARHDLADGPPRFPSTRLPRFPTSIARGRTRSVARGGRPCGTSSCAARCLLS